MWAPSYGSAAIDAAAAGDVAVPDGRGAAALGIGAQGWADGRRRLCGGVHGHGAERAE